MKHRLFHFLKLFILYFIVFLILKVFFLLYYWELSLEAGIIDSLKIFWHGLRLDISATAYIMLIPAVLLGISSFLKYDLYKALIK